jgi:chromosome segregation ATPase
LEPQITETKLALNRISSQVAQLEEQIKRKAECEKEAAENEKTLANLIIEITDLEKEIGELKIALGGITAKIDTTKSKLKFGTKAEALVAINQKRETLSQMRASLIASQKAYEDCKEAVDKAKAVITEMQSRLAAENTEMVSAKEKAWKMFLSNVVLQTKNIIEVK